MNSHVVGCRHDRGLGTFSSELLCRSPVNTARRVIKVRLALGSEIDLQSHGEHRTLTLEVGEPSLISQNLPTCILARSRPRNHTHSTKNFFFPGIFTNTLSSVQRSHIESHSIIVTASRCRIRRLNT